MVFGVEHTPLIQLPQEVPPPQELSDVQADPQAGGVWQVFVPGLQTEHPPVAPLHEALLLQVEPQAGPDVGVGVGVDVDVGVIIDVGVGVEVGVDVGVGVIVGSTGVLGVGITQRVDEPLQSVGIC